MTKKSAVNATLIIDLPATTSTQANTIEVTNFTAEGTAVTYNFADNNRMNAKIGVDGSSEVFDNPNTVKFIEFTIVPLSDIDAELIKFNLASGKLPMVVQFKDKNVGVNLLSEKGYFKTVPDTIIASDPDYKTYRIELFDSIIT